MINFYELPKMQKFLKQTPVFNDKTGMYLNAHCLEIGGTGSGKTNALMNYLYNSDDLFSKIVILFKNEEPLYTYLYNSVEEGMVSFYTSPNDIPRIEELSTEVNPPDENDKRDKQKKRNKLPEVKNILFIIDDWVDQADKFPIINDYFLRGRKFNITLFFLSQSYYKTPKFIRQNVSYIWLVKVNTYRDLKMIASEYTSLVTEKELIQMYEVATSEKFNFLKIDMKTNDANMKFSINFLGYFKIK